MNIDREIEKLFKSYYSPLVNYINRYLNNIDNSEEVVQESFLKLWKKREEIQINTSIKSYLYRSAKNTMIDFIRKQKRDIDLDGKIQNKSTYNEEAALDPYIIREEILKALDKLTPRTKKIFILSKLEGLTYEEIANHLEISKRTVENNMAKAFFKLREILIQNNNIF